MGVPRHLWARKMDSLVCPRFLALSCGHPKALEDVQHSFLFPVRTSVGMAFRMKIAAMLRWINRKTAGSHLEWPCLKNS